jgi:hypothetical protein
MPSTAQHSDSSTDQRRLAMALPIGPVEVAPGRAVADPRAEVVVTGGAEGAGW